MVKVEYEIKLGFQDVLIRPKRSKLSSRSQVDLTQNYTWLHAKGKWSGVPIIAANMDTTGTFEMAKTFSKNRCIVAIHKHYSVNEWIKFAKEMESEEQKSPKNSSQNEDEESVDTSDSSPLKYVAVSAGSSQKDFEKLCQIFEAVPKLQFICLDVANGYSEHFTDCVKRTREKFPTKVIMAGNVVTGEMTEQLLLSGADIVKVGIGPGSVCTTRKKTGVGYPQLSAVLECADAAHGIGGRVISDGGCTTPGDFAKAFGAGADFVMAGGIFAGHDESGGEIITKPDGKKYKLFYGMSSSTAMEKYSGGVASYRASEGKTVSVTYRGPVEKTIHDILGGIRSACTYTGSARLKELSKRTTFIRVTRQYNTIFGDEKK